MKKRTINQITKREARHVAKLLNAKYASLTVWDDRNDVVMITVNKDSDSDENIYINSNGLVSYFCNNGEPGGSKHKDINALPVTDYLRKKGFKFVY